MLIQFFPNGKGSGAAPVGYLIATEVLAYDDNRDLCRDARGNPLTVSRDPRPEVLRGDPARTEALIDACPYQWTYRAGVISFTREDAPDEQQQAEVIDRFEELAFAGLERDQYDCLWVRHTHEDRVELHFCTPRLELSTGKSLNIAPPGYQAAFDSLRDMMNKAHNWADPLDAERARTVQHPPEALTRAQGREELQSWILDQISVGAIHNRTSMTEVLCDVGYELPRISKDYLTVKDPKTGERWRLKGDIFREGWQAPTATSEREVEHRSGQDQAGESRLDAITADELQERFKRYCDQRADYNRVRYQSLPELERHALDRTAPDDLARAEVQTLDDLGGDVSGEHGLALSNVGLVRTDRADASNRHPAGDWHGGAPRPEWDVFAFRSSKDHADDMQHPRERIALLSSGGLTGERGDEPIGARIAGLRREVGHVMRGLSEGITRFREALNATAQRHADWFARMREAAHTLAAGADRVVHLRSERIRDLRSAGREVEQQCAVADERRSEIEITLTERAHAYERDLGDDYELS